MGDKDINIVQDNVLVDLSTDVFDFKFIDSTYSVDISSQDISVNISQDNITVEIITSAEDVSLSDGNGISIIESPTNTYTISVVESEIEHSSISGIGANSHSDIDIALNRLENTFGTNTGDQDLSGLALKTNVLELDNTDAFTPDADYEPATKKYVDDEVATIDGGSA